jgi:transposase InsO family protein
MQCIVDDLNHWMSSSYHSSYLVTNFYSRLKVKVELIYAEQYRSIEEARSGIFEYIEVFYNRLRRHSALGYVSPAEFERIGA